MWSALCELALLLHQHPPLSKSALQPGVCILEVLGILPGSQAFTLQHFCMRRTLSIGTSHRASGGESTGIRTPVAIVGTVGTFFRPIED